MDCRRLLKPGFLIRSVRRSRNEAAHLLARHSRFVASPTSMVGLCLSSQQADAVPTEAVIDSPMLTQKIKANRTIMVDINGGGDFKSVQAAIDSVPLMNSQWVIIHVRKGHYREKVRIPPNKPFIFLRGNGKGKTYIVWSQSATDNTDSATFRLESPNFVAFGISFKNEAPVGEAFTSQNQSVAAFVGQDKAAFYHCAFYSNHNTLFDYKGRHYYDHCYIQGSIDFIFGRARSIFQISDMRVHIHGSITAQNREEADESGFVFIKGKVYGIGEVYLGRAKGAHSRVVFCRTYLSKTIAPEGWSNWSYVGSTQNLFQAEYKTYGPGAAKDKRVPWAKQLTDKEAGEFMSIDFVDGKLWLPVWLE
ncbi:Probable pectinesterase 67 [Linum perenne]